MGKAERFGVILSRLSAGDVVEVDDLARILDVSGATIRRDLRDLADKSLLTRVHGGAVVRNVPYELPMRDRSAQQAQEKRRISAAAAELVSNGAVIGVSGGTTTTEVARALSARSGLTVVTNALNVAAELIRAPGVQMMVTGGMLRPESFEMVGAVAEQTIGAIHLDVLFLGATGVDAGAGCTTYDVVEAATNAAMVRQAQKVVVVADSTKLGRIAFAEICPLAEVDLLVTDAPLADPGAGDRSEALQRLRDAGLAIRLV